MPIKRVSELVMLVAAVLLTGCMEDSQEVIENCYQIENVMSVLTNIRDSSGRYRSELPASEVADEELLSDESVWFAWIKAHVFDNSTDVHFKAHVCSNRDYELIAFGKDFESYLLTKERRPLLLSTRSGRFVSRNYLTGSSHPISPVGDLNMALIVRADVSGDLTVEYENPESGARFKDEGFDGMDSWAIERDAGFENFARVDNQICPVILGCPVCKKQDEWESGELGKLAMSVAESPECQNLASLLLE